MKTFVRAGGPDGGRPRGDGAAANPRRGRTWGEIMHPEGSQGTWRDLPRLLGDSLRLVWTSGRNVFVLTSALQLVAALGIAAQLFIGKEVLETVLAAGGGAEFGDLVPVLAALVGVTVALDLARAVENEQSRVLGELVGRLAALVPSGVPQQGDLAR